MVRVRIKGLMGLGLEFRVRVRVRELVLGLWLGYV